MNSSNSNYLNHLADPINTQNYHFLNKKSQYSRNSKNLENFNQNFYKNEFNEQYGSENNLPSISINKNQIQGQIIQTKISIKVQLNGEDRERFITVHDLNGNFIIDEQSGLLTLINCSGNALFDDKISNFNLPNINCNFNTENICESSSSNFNSNNYVFQNHHYYHSNPNFHNYPQQKFPSQFE